MPESFTRPIDEEMAAARGGWGAGDVAASPICFGRAFTAGGERCRSEANGPAKRVTTTHHAADRIAATCDDLHPAARPLPKIENAQQHSFCPEPDRFYLRAFCPVGRAALSHRVEISGLG